MEKHSFSVPSFHMSFPYSPTEWSQPRSLSTFSPDDSFGKVLDRHRGIGPGFDSIRLLLALIILVSHAKLIAGDITAGETLVKGAIAAFQHEPEITGLLRPLKVALVPLFFALSGFLVTGSALRMHEVGGFLLARAVRIFPALIVEVALSALVLGPLLTTVALKDYFSEASFFSYFGNVLGFVHLYLPGVFLENPWAGVVNMNLWTLPAEFYCYLFTSVAMISSIIFNRAIFGAMFLAATSVLIVLSLTTGFGVSPGIYSISAIVYYFFVGSAFYLYKDVIPSNWLLFWLSAICSYVLLDFARAVFIAPVFVVYCLVFLGTRTFLKVPGLKNIDCSYGIYLYGFPIAQSLIVLFPHFQGRPFIFVPFVCAATFAFAVLSWHFIERPLLRMKQLRFRQQQANA
jgi:peptidoglycan/LPS O-acetylase OafA/YrhL